MNLKHGKAIGNWETGIQSCEQTIVKTIKFLQVFYELKPHGREICRSYIDDACDFKPWTSRRWLQAASRVLPLVHDGYAGDYPCEKTYRLKWKTIDECERNSIAS